MDKYTITHKATGEIISEDDFARTCFECRTYYSEEDLGIPCCGNTFECPFYEIVKNE